MDETFGDGRSGGPAAEQPPVLKRDRKALRSSPPTDEPAAPPPAEPASAPPLFAAEAPAVPQPSVPGVEPSFAPPLFERPVFDVPAYDPPSEQPAPVGSGQFEQPLFEPAQPDEDEWNPFAELDPEPEPTEPERVSESVPPAYEAPAFEAPVYEAPATFSWTPTDEPAVPVASNAFGLPAETAATVIPAEGGAFPAPGDHSVGSAGGDGPGHPIFGDLTPSVADEPRELKVLDVAAMATAIVLPPVGLILGIIALIRGRLFRGWASTLARVAIRVSLVMIVIFALGGAYLGVQESKRAEAQAEADAAAAKHNAVVAESAEFCEALAASPAAFAPDDSEYGWPALDDPAGYLPAITAYATAWQSFVPLAPSGITEQTASFSARVDSIVAIAKGLQAENRPGDLLTLTEQGDIATIAAYAGEYCS